MPKASEQFVNQLMIFADVLAQTIENELDYGNGHHVATQATLEHMLESFSQMRTISDPYAEVEDAIHQVVELRKKDVFGFLDDDRFET